MAVARRDQALQEAAPARTGRQTGPALRPAHLKLVPDARPAARGPLFDLHPGQVKQSPRQVTDTHVSSVAAPAQRPSRPPVSRVAARGERREGSLTGYILFLMAGSAVGLAITAQFVAANQTLCSGGDAQGNCMLQKLVAPGLTRFAIALICAHGLATLILDVIPDIRRKRAAGYRLRQEAKAPAIALPEPGAPLNPLAAACWAPVQTSRTSTPTRAGIKRAVARAVCPSCVTVVATHEGSCLECGGPVVARRG